MSGKRLSVFGIAAILSASIAVLANSESETLKQLAGYREWARVTDKPVAVTSFFPLA